MNMQKIKGLRVRSFTFALVASSALALCGCAEKELAPDEDYDVVSMNNNDDSQLGGDYNRF